MANHYSCYVYVDIQTKVVIVKILFLRNLSPILGIETHNLEIKSRTLRVSGWLSQLSI